MARTLIPLSDGVEEMEAVIAADTLRRAGWKVVLAGLTDDMVTASRGVKIHTDQLWDRLDPLSFDLLLLPGGAEGARHLADDERITAALRAFNQANKWIAAICAAPAVVLHPAGILQGRNATCYEGADVGLDNTNWSNDRVVVDRHIVTSRGPATAFAFAVKLIRLIDGAAAADKVASGLLLT